MRQGSRSLTYRQLAATVAALEAALCRNGVGRGRIVVVAMEDRLALVPTMLAVLRRGAVFVPLDPGAPPARFRALLNAVAPDAIVSDGTTGPTVAAAAAGCDTKAQVALDVGAIGLHLHGRPRDARRRWPSPRRFDFIYFTSGSTGSPKGICGRLAGVSHLVDWEIGTLELADGCRVAQSVVPTFDPYLRDVFVPLCSGGTVCIPPLPPSRTDPADFLRWLDEERIALVHTVPSLLAEWLRGAGRCRDLGFAELAWLLLSGEPFPAATVRAWRRLFGTRTRFMNLYGVSEATMFQLSHEVTARDLRRAWLPVGEAVPGFAVELADGDGGARGPDEPGEVVLHSRFLALGYLDDRAATRAAFGVDRTGERTFRTGDQAVRLADGSLRLVGRRDDQVKIRGVRVECGEVEALLSRHPMVGACAVVATRRRDAAVGLVAFLQPRFHDRPAVPELRRFLRDHLSQAMIPARFEVRDALPVLPNGKVDRAALSRELPRLRTGPVRRPRGRDRIERLVADAWAEALAAPAVGAGDDFFALGGHSLTAVAVIMRLQRALRVSLSLSDIFAHPTLAGLARYVREAVARGKAGRSPRRGADGAARPVSHAMSAPADGFHCPAQPSPWFGQRRCALVLIVNEQLELASFERLARLVRGWDRRIVTVVLPDDAASRPRLPDAPMLVVAPAVIRYPIATVGPVFSGRPMAKSEELARLEGAGIPVPEWERLTAESQPDCSRLGEYVVRKPDFGAKGARVQIVKRSRLRWKPLETGAGGPSGAIIAQRFVYTGPRPVSYRVNTLFGRVLYAIRLEANPSRKPLAGPADFRSVSRGDAVSIVSNARDSVMTFCNDAAIIRLGEAAAAAFPECPLLGVDVVREHDTGRPFVLEVNAIGYNWNFTSRERSEWPLDPSRQFDGERKAAWLLAEQTQRLAR